MLTILLAALDNETDRKDFTRLFERYHVKMEKVTASILSERRDAEDAVQNAFMQIIKHFEKIHTIPCEELVFWLISIVKNEALMIMRKRGKTVPLEDWDGFASGTGDIRTYAELVRLFTCLPETYRAVLEIKILLEYTDKEIAKYLGITETAVSTRANRGRVLLRNIAEKEGFHA